MTTTSGVKVTLQSGDWLKLAAIAFSIIAALLGAYLRHDRMLSQVLHGMQLQEQRLSLLEQRLWDARRPPSGSLEAP